MREQFDSLVATITDAIADQPLDASLQARLDTDYGADSAWFDAMRAACTTGVAEGWLCGREAGGIRFGRVIQAGEATRGFSVDVVDMQDCAGPHHRHPLGEIDLVMPVTPGARFDGTPAGWKVYGPDTAHRPTVSDGRALVLYLLPEGQIEFTR